MDTLLYFALWAGIIFVMMRFGCGAHLMGHGRGHGPNQAHHGNARPDGEKRRWIAPSKDADPVCGRAVSTDKAKPSFFDGYVYYFCSRECREVFEAAPDLYVGGERQRGPRPLEHSHV